MSVRTAGVSIFAAVMLVGCASSPLQPDTIPDGSSGPKFPGPKTDAGVPVTQSADPLQFKKLVAQRASAFGHGRPDPFALTPYERDFDNAQASERVFSESGGFKDEFTHEPDVPPQESIQAQPYRRLSGIVVGDSVLAIIEMGEGQEPTIIRPGMRIPNSEWTVVSIDQDKAVLRRSGDVLPREIEVRLESPPPGYQPNGGANFGPGGGPGGGRPGGPGGGGPGGGRPGGPGGGGPRRGGAGGGAAGGD